MINNIEARNAKINKYGAIDLEINHPNFGWIPFTASQNDVEEYGRLIYEDAINGKYGDIEPYIEPLLPEQIIQIPQSITMRQARLYLLQISLLDSVDLILATNRAWQIEWEYATEVQRSSILVAALAEQLGLTSEQLDNMFIEASKL